MTDATVITVYSKSNCQPCRATKRKLDMLGLPYVEVDLDHSPEDVEKLRALGYQESPVVDVAGAPEGMPKRTWSGYRPDLLTTLADLIP